MLSFFILYFSSWHYFTVFGVILKTPTAPIIISTKYGKGTQQFCLMMHILWHCFVQCGKYSICLPFTLNGTLSLDNVLLLIQCLV